MSSFRINTPFSFLADVIRNETSEGGDGVQGPVGQAGPQGPVGSGSAVDAGGNPVHYGYQSGATDQSMDSTAVGVFAGQQSQQAKAVAIGYRAGQVNQGENAIAIGVDAGIEDQPANSIILNASDQPVNATGTGFFVRPVSGIPSTDDFSANCLLGYVRDESVIRGTVVQEYNLSDTLLSILNLPARGPTGGLSQPGRIDYGVAGMFYTSPFQTWNVVYVPDEIPGNAGKLRFTENGISSQMTLDSFMEVGITLSDVGGRWEEAESTRLWKAVSMSVSGQYQTAIVASGSNAYVSDDFGQTWTASSLPNSENWVDVKVSGSGQYQVIISSTNIYASTDFGASWTLATFAPVADGEAFTSVNAVVDGSSFYVTSTNPSEGSGSFRVSSYYMNYIFNSRFFINYENDPPTFDFFRGNMTSVAIAAGGYVGYVATNQVLAGGRGTLTEATIYRTYNNFTDPPKRLGFRPAGPAPWKQVACSGSGKTVVAIAEGLDEVWCSNDYGDDKAGTADVSWTMSTVPNPSRVAVSFTGQYIIVVQDGGSAYVSTTYGASFEPATSLPNGAWQGVAMSAAGQLMTAVGSNTFVNRAENPVYGNVGESGSQGFQGFQGFQGPGIGERGFQGLQGYRGFVGYRGLQGYLGFQGYDGFQGVQGSTGSGERGFQGFEGIGGGLVYKGVFFPDGLTGLVPSYFTVTLPEGSPQQIIVIADNVTNGDATASPALMCRLNNALEGIELTNVATSVQTWTITRLGLGNRWTITTGQGSIGVYDVKTLSNPLTQLEFYSVMEDFTAEIYIYYQ